MHRKDRHRDVATTRGQTEGTEKRPRRGEREENGISDNRTSSWRCSMYVSTYIRTNIRMYIQNEVHPTQRRMQQTYSGGWTRASRSVVHFPKDAVYIARLHVATPSPSPVAAVLFLKPAIHLAFLAARARPSAR